MAFLHAIVYGVAKSQTQLSDFHKITADGDRSHEIKKTLDPWKKSMTNLDSILKSRDIILLTKVHIFKAMVFQSCMDMRVVP